MKARRFLAIVSIALILAYLVKESLGNGDFKVYLDASKMFLEGQNPNNFWF